MGNKEKRMFPSGTLEALHEPNKDKDLRPEKHERIVPKYKTQVKYIIQLTFSFTDMGNKKTTNRLPLRG